ncbi:MAG: Maf-like protein YhdE [Candidatus Accumulibacter adjunctus]|uniref:Maf-like protein YhdE n=1 Tax=Candidatus Accumulibacter adjunctus TaxID=1454001 RepID=A0A011MDB9_9PROT|nr:MAG: Maf-like protein YhdE [Candidatus Accumulibacter adjunctus]
MALSIRELPFRTRDEQEIRYHVASGESIDKAGRYGRQGPAAMFGEHLAGSYSEVMGLPLCETARLLKRYGYVL